MPDQGPWRTARGRGDASSQKPVSFLSGTFVTFVFDTKEEVSLI